MSDFPPAPPPNWSDNQPPQYPPNPGVPQGYQPYGQPGFRAPQQTNGLAIASMVCGILGIVICWPGLVLGIIAVVLAMVAKRKINESNGTMGGGGMATAGLVTGIIAVVLWGGLLLLAIANSASS